MSNPYGIGLTHCRACHGKLESPNMGCTLGHMQANLDLCESCRAEVEGPIRGLLTDTRQGKSSNPKLAKGDTNYRAHVMHLAPARLSGFNVCPMATRGCEAACLNTAGRGGILKPGCSTNSIQRKRIIRTRQYYTRRGAFMARLVREVENAIKRSLRDGVEPAFRLNGTSDIRWEHEPVRKDGVDYENIMLAFPQVQWYDYTKLPNRRQVPANYHLTFSLADGNAEHAVVAMCKGVNVAAVFSPGLPAEYYGLPVVDGDKTDLRFLDPVGVIVGLSAKGKARRDRTGFVQRVEV